MMVIISTFEIFFISIFISIIGYNKVNGAIPGKIVGGMNTEIGEFPFMVSLIRRGRHFCGATIVSENFLVTAAHCLCRYDDPVGGTLRDLNIFKFHFAFVNLGSN